MVRLGAHPLTHEISRSVPGRSLNSKEESPIEKIALALALVLASSSLSSD